MATFERRGLYWRVKVRRAGLPPQTRTFDNKTQAQLWARSVESEIDKGIVVDRRLAERLSLAEVLERYRREVTPTKRGAADENLRLKAMAQRPLARVRMAALTSSHLAADDAAPLVVDCAGVLPAGSPPGRTISGVTVQAIRAGGECRSEVHAR